jgi:hypothetical protein
MEKSKPIKKPKPLTLIRHKANHRILTPDKPKPTMEKRKIK